MEKEKKTTYLPTKFSLGIRIAVALYLFYTVYSLRGVTEKYGGTELLFFIAAIVLFGVIAVFLCINSVKALITGKYVGGAMDIHEDEETVGEENAPAIDTVIGEKVEKEEK